MLEKGTSGGATQNPSPISTSEGAPHTSKTVIPTTEPTSAEPDLGSVAVNLVGIADSSARLLDIANQPIPTSLPLTAREPFDDLDAFRRTLEPLAADAVS